jgi:hypothetical protein
VTDKSSFRLAGSWIAALKLLKLNYVPAERSGASSCFEAFAKADCAHVIAAVLEKSRDRSPYLNIN